MDALTLSTNGQLASFQTVMNVIMDHIAPSQPAAPAAATSPAMIQQHLASTSQVTGAIAPSVVSSVPVPLPIPAPSMTTAPPPVPPPLPASTFASQPMTSFPQGSYALPSIAPPDTYGPGVLFSQPHAIQQNSHVPTNPTHFLPSATGPPSC